MQIPQQMYRRWGKRAFDILCASAALTVLAPAFAILAIAVRVTIGAPALFRQIRGGLDQEPFVILKFRSMTEDRDEAGEILPDAARLSRLGRFLRSTSLDELPELLNVLRGEMSLVGPRPLLTRYQPWYTPEEMQRFSVLPGITGLAQINGRNSLNWEERFQYDVQYAQNYSLLLDLKILFNTVGKVLRREDVHVDTSLTLRSLDEERRAKQQLFSVGGNSVR